jgi:metal-sulfur cluster biosynthetic enzyme
MKKLHKYKLNKELIYELIKEIKDPEKDTTLEDLSIINEDNIFIVQTNSYDSINIIWTPTTPHCSLALQIGLSIRHKLNIELKDLMGINYRYKLTLTVEKGKHLKEDEINKQLNDKERYYAAFENKDIVMYINSLINNKYFK